MPDDDDRHLHDPWTTRASAGLLALGAAAGALALGVRHRKDLRRARDRLARVDRRVIDTTSGRLEYADVGTGEPVLVSHGIFHGRDGGLLSARPIVGDRRVVAPSRFGYLGSDLPADASAATQADAFAELLDHLGLRAVDVLAISAGTVAAIQLALRHPTRVRHLVISSGSFPGSATASPPPAWARALYSDRAMWTLATVARPLFSRLMGVPAGFPRDDAEARLVDELLESIFPVDPRAAGAVFDAYVSNPQIDDCPLESVRVPTLVVHARDDPLASFDAAAEGARRIPASRLLALESGGHLQLGQGDRVRSEVGTFLAAGGDPPVNCG